MSKLLVGLLLAVISTASFANGYHGGYHGGHGGYYGGYHGPVYHSGYRGGWGYGDVLVPMVIGGAVGYAISEANRQPQIIYQQPPVVYQQPSTTVYQKCTAWIETVDQYGVTTRTRTCY